MLAEIVKQVVEQSGEEEVAIDATGVESTSASAYFCTRSGRKRKKLREAVVVRDLRHMLPASLVMSWGPCSDKAMAKELLHKSIAAVQPKTLFADAGYDAEWVHEYCRDGWGVDSWIPPAAHRKDGGVNWKYRSKMTPRRLKKNGYGRRWIVESFMSGLKRTTGSMLAARQQCVHVHRSSNSSTRLRTPGLGTINTCFCFQQGNSKTTRSTERTTARGRDATNDNRTDSNLGCSSSNDDER